VEVIKERRRVREEVIGKVSEWARSLPFKCTVVLVGSYARGDFNLWSDVDVLVISDELKGTPLERMKNIDAPSGFQVIPLTVEEYRWQEKKGNSLVVEAKRKGVLVRDDEKLFK